MRRKIIILYFSILALLMAVCATLAFMQRGKAVSNVGDIVKKDIVEQVLREKYNYISDKTESALGIVATKSDSVNVEFFDSLASDFADYGIGFFHYERGRLQHWSTNDIPVPVEFSRMLGDRFVKLGNGFYMCCMKLEEQHAVVGLFQIKKEYSYENDKLIESFNASLGLPSIIDVSADSVVNSMPVRLPVSDKDIYFSMADENFGQDSISIPQVMKLCLLLLVIVALLSLFVILTRRYQSRSWIFALCFIASLVCVRLVLWATGFFDGFGSLQMFSPQLLSTSFLQYSFGEMLLNSVLFLVGAMFFCHHFKPNFTITKSRITGVVVSSLFAVAIVCATISIVYFMSEIVLDSSIQFNLVNWSDIDEYGCLAVLVMAIVVFSTIFIERCLVRIFAEHINVYLLLLLVFVSLTVFAVVCWFAGENYILPCLIFWAIWAFVICCDINGYHSFGLKTALMIMVSLLVACTVLQKTISKEAESYKVLAYNMLAERDFEIEFNFISLDEEIRSDKEFSDSLKAYSFNSADSIINNLISSKKYLKRYDSQVTICMNSDSLMYDNDDYYSANCFEFFRSQVQEYGIIIPNTNFYYLDNNNGRQSYLGIYSVMVEPSVYVKVFIELNSKIFSEGLGYPDLLIDKKMAMKHRDKDFDFARYSKGVLVASRGSYKYLFSLRPESDSREFSVEKLHGYKHFKYCPDAENVIILSKRDNEFSNAFILFFFVLLCVFVVSGILYAIDKARKRDVNISGGLARRIRASFMVVLIISLFLTMMASVFFIVNTYNGRQKEAVLDKVHSVDVELSHSLNLNQLKDENPDYVHDMLVYLSNILYVDINIYDVQGVLMASSRQEFFDKGLKGRFMDPSSYRHLIMSNDELFVHDEVIDKADYLSVYLPLKDKSNRTVAYLNLPYFAAESEIQEEMSNYVAVFASILLLLVLFALVSALFVSRQMTTPLSQLQASISEMDIDKANKIEYDRNDEIGLLINEYNRKIDELAESAQKLAASERESAWREMARQIAHEIRNPLTPMKLRIQYLERAYHENAPGWEKMLEQLPQMLIEQIDVLDATASQFSEFAKMQAPQKSQVNIREIIGNIVDLHNGTNGVEVKADIKADGDTFVFVDRDQILRVFTNLVKNSIQAIPEGREGKVSITLEDADNSYLVSVKDNGCGIDDNVRSKIFQPNFTTKSSGMGLGLSMVKNILFGNGVEIDFNTEVGVGTEFKLRFDKWKR